VKSVGKITSGEREQTVKIISTMNVAGSFVPHTFIYPRKLLNVVYINKPKRGHPGPFWANRQKVPDDVRLEQVGSHKPQY